MLEVKIEKILPVTEARDNFNKLVDEVEGGDELYVLTKNGKPAAVLVGVHHLEKLTGTSESELMAEANETEDKESDSDIEPETEEQPTNATTSTDEKITDVEETPAENVSPIATASENPSPETEKTDDTEEITTPSAKPEAEEAVIDNQQSGATSTPFGGSAPAPAEDDKVVEDPLDFLDDTDDDTMPAETNSAETLTAPDNTNATPSSVNPTPVANTTGAASTPVAPVNPAPTMGSTTPSTPPAAAPADQASPVPPTSPTAQL